MTQHTKNKIVIYIVTVVACAICSVLLKAFHASTDVTWGVAVIVGYFFGVGYGVLCDLHTKKKEAIDFMRWYYEDGYGAKPTERHFESMYDDFSKSKKK